MEISTSEVEISRMSALTLAAAANTAAAMPGVFCMRAAGPGTVLEVKYDAFLPEIVRMAVQVPGRQAAACSKYALCRRLD